MALLAKATPDHRSHIRAVLSESSCGACCVNGACYVG